MRLKDIYNSNKPVISYEIFPLKDDNKEKTEILFNELKELCLFNPAYISVTYGAGGSTREKTLDLVLKIKNELKVEALPHFTCVGASKTEILEYLKEIENSDIKNILALRGDPPKGQTDFVKPKDGFGYANELVGFIKSNLNLGIAVAGYSECHQDCECLDLDIENLKRKVDAGADIIITQLFFENKFFFNFVEKAKKAGINIPIIPGILPVTSLSQIEKITSLCACTLPEKFMSDLKKVQDDKNAMAKIGINFALKQCQELLDSNVSGLHFYTLNKSFAVKSVLEKLNVSELAV